MLRPQGTGGGTGAPGRILDVAFHGPFTRYRVVLETSGRHVEVLVGVLGEPRMATGDAVVVEGPADPVRARRTGWRHRRPPVRQGSGAGSFCLPLQEWDR
ncbi:MAG: TOBE domain-containing protein [Microthrixaceae bacterium]